MIAITLNDGTVINYNTFDEIVDYEKIIKLDCSNNELTELPNIINLMTNLRELYCYDNELTSLPPSIGSLTNLTWLSCFYNELTSLPDSIGNLTNLTKLYCYDNELTSLPDSIGNLINLIIFDYSFNNLTSLPPSIINLRNITEISNFNNFTPQQQRYYNWIKSSKKNDFNEHYEDFLIKSALKLS
jgi:internalin A